MADSTGCAAFPVTLAPGASCDLVVGYTPLNAGGNSGSVAIQASVAGSSWTIALSGQGTAAASNAAPTNKGGGGCSASDDVNDPMMVFLMIAAAIAIGWRRRQSKRIGG